MKPQIRIKSTGPEGFAMADRLAVIKPKVNGQVFALAVTYHARSCQGVRLTHIHSGISVCEVTQSQIAAALGDYAAAGRLALDALISEKGAERVADVLSRANTYEKP